MSFMKLASLGGGVFADLVVFQFSGNRLDYIFEDSIYFVLDPLFALLINFLTNQP